MRVHTLPVILSVFLLATNAAFAQAASEWVLLNGNSATAAGKAGTLLGNSVHRTHSKVAGKSLKITPPTSASSTSKRSPRPHLGYMVRPGPIHDQ